MGFTPIDDAVMRRTDLSFGAKCVYSRLLRYSQGGRCNPSLKTLGRELGISRDQARYYIRQLKKARCLKVTTGLGRTHTSYYSIEPLEKVVTLPPFSNGKGGKVAWFSSAGKGGNFAPEKVVKLPPKDTNIGNNEKQKKPAATATVPDDWGKSLAAIREHYPTTSVETFFRLVNDRARSAGFTDDELAQGIREHGRGIRMRHLEINPILFGLKVMDAISVERQLSPKPVTVRDDGADQPPQHEPSIELSRSGVCPTHKHEVVWTPKRGEHLCVNCRPPPEGLGDEAERRVSEWWRNEDQLPEELRATQQRL